MILERLELSFALYDELVAGLAEESLQATLPGLPLNTIGAQLWCVVGARESYARAIEAGEWAGFSCSLTSAGTRAREAVAAALGGSAAAVRAAMTGLEHDDEARYRLALQLLEHEAAHHGQLIRYLYGLRLPIPPLWQERYALDWRTNSSTRAASSFNARRAAASSFPNGSSFTRPCSSCHVPATKPSTRIVACTRPFFVTIREGARSPRIRERSACERTRLSKRGTSRGGAGSSASGSGARGRS